MRKVGIVFSIALVIALALTAYFAYLALRSSSLTGSSSSQTSTSLPSWSNALKLAQTDCDPNAISRFKPQLSEDILQEYFVYLLKQLGVETGPPPGYRILTPDIHVFSTWIPGTTCRLAWAGDSSGKGSVIYETPDGFKKQSVIGVPFQGPSPTP